MTFESVYCALHDQMPLTSEKVEEHAKPQVYFVFPYKGMGGVPVLFVRVGEYLASKGLIDAYFVDYEDGTMAKMMFPGIANLVPYIDAGPTVIPDGAYAVFQAMTPWSFFPGLVIADSVKLLFWNCHPFNLIPTLPGIRTYMHTHLFGARWLLRTIMWGWRQKMRAFLDTLLTHQAIVFMDANNVYTTKEYLESSFLDVNYLPIPVSTSGVKKRLSRVRDWVSEPTVRIVWLGRVVDFKFYILKRTLQSIAAVRGSLAHPIELTIIGDGEYHDALQIVANDLTHVQVKFIEQINISELDAFLLENADLLMAMGTSVLEGARLGIPAILLDMSYSEVSRNYRFQWLYEREGYTLGDMITNQHLDSHDQSLLQRLNELIQDYDAQSERCQQYVNRNHALEVQADRFKHFLLGSNLTWGDLATAGYLRRGWLYIGFCKLRDIFLRR